ncbi:hypothetical protein D3C81_1945510 [compost metagenome]
MKAAAGVARNIRIPTRSVGIMPRGIHCRLAARSRSSTVGLTVRSTSVATIPGRMQLTVMPCGPSSRARELVMPMMADLEVT